VDNETYIIPENFVETSCTVSGNNVTIKQQNPYLQWDKSILWRINNNNINIEDFYIRNMYFYVYSGKTNFTINNNIMYAQTNNIFDYASSFNGNIYNIVMTNNYIENIALTKPYLFRGTTTGGSNTLSVNGLKLENNTFLNLGGMTVGHTFGASRQYVYVYDLEADNNILDFDTSSGSNSFISGTYLKTPYIASDNYLGWATLTDDLNYDKIDDAFYVFGTLYNAKPLLQKEFTTAYPYNNKTSIAFQMTKGIPTYYETNTDYYMTRDITLDSTNYFNLLNVINTNIYLSHDLTVTAVNVFRMGYDNAIIGRLNDRTYNRITTTGSIISVYDDTGVDTSNHAIMSYISNTRLENIYIDLSATGNYGFIRKTSTLTGNHLNFINSEMHVKFIPSTIETPLFYVGSNMELRDNLFNWHNNINDTNYYAFFRGSSGGIDGGHKIINNQFKGGGNIFLWLQGGVASSSQDSVYIHNEFSYDLSYFSEPFDAYAPRINSISRNPLLNGTYYYKIACDSYTFNLGNYYEDSYDIYNPLGLWNDSNIDGIMDTALLRGIDIDSSNINDYRPLFSYPFDFNANIGNAESIVDLCGSFNFNIVAPIENNTYPTSTNITTSWNYVSSAYSDMYCFEKLNSETNIYPNVPPSTSNGLEYDTTDGYGTFQITCCDTPECDNLKKESDIINFCVGNCNNLLIVENIGIPPVSVLGCTDILATNYNPLATVDDGSCVYSGTVCGNSIIEAGETCDDGNVINGDGCSSACLVETNATGGNVFGGGIDGLVGGTIEETADNTVSFFGALTTGITSIIIPVGLFFFVLLMIGGTVALLR